MIKYLLQDGNTTFDISTLHCIFIGMRNPVATKTRLILLPLLPVLLIFSASYIFLYWLFCIQFHLVDLKQEMVHWWIPALTALLLVFIFFRQRIHLLRIERSGGRPRGLYYIVAAAFIYVPTLFLLELTDTATGKLSKLDLVGDINQKPPTKYYQFRKLYYDKSHAGVHHTISYSGKRNETLNFDIYIATPMMNDVSDSMLPVPAFCFVHYHDSYSSDMGKEERSRKLGEFWTESAFRYEQDPLLFQYFEKPPNTATRDGAMQAARNSEAYKGGRDVIVLRPVNEPFSKHNGNNLQYALLSLVIGLAIWFIMLLIPPLDERKLEAFERSEKPSWRSELDKSLAVVTLQKELTTTWLLIGVNVLVFITMVGKGLGVSQFPTKDLLHWGAVYRPSIEKGQWWRLITGMFLHGGIAHLVFNMFSLYLCGVFLEKMVGPKRYLLAYVISGIAAGLASIWWHKEPVVAVGASGAIFGLYGILLALIVSKKLDPVLNKLLLIVLAGTAGYSLVMGLLSPTTDNSAHVGGLLAGFVIGLFYARSGINNEWVKTEP